MSQHVKELENIKANTTGEPLPPLNPLGKGCLGKVSWNTAVNTL